MTLYRQVLILLLLAMLVSLTAVMTLSLQSNSSYLQQQLRISTDAAVTSLGMRLAPLLKPMDKVLVESTINAAFDGALLQRIDVELFADDSHITRSRELRNEGVPGWFLSLFHIEKVVTEAPLTQGWSEVALLTVEGHPGGVYKQLWSLAIRLTLIYSLLFVILAAITAVALRWLIRPLQQIEHQARAIEQKDYDYRIPLPRTRELRRVVDVLNGLTALLKGRFLAHAGQLEEVRARLLVDADSGLMTRRALLDSLASLQSEGRPGALVLLRVEHADEIRRQCGFHQWREVFDEASVLVRSLLSPDADSASVAIGRLSSQELAILLEGPVPESPEQSLTELCQAISNIKPQQTSDIVVDGAAVGISIGGDHNVGQLLTRLDTELRICVSGNNRARWVEEKTLTYTLRTAEQWLSLLRERLDQQALQLRWQPVVTRNGEVLQREVFASVVDEQKQSLHAGLFVPVIEQFDLGAFLDQAVMKEVLAQPVEGLVAINLSLSAMRDTRFISRLSSMTVREKLLFEVSELNLNREYETVTSFASLMRQMGYSLGVDQVGASGRSLDYLTVLRPTYVKVAPGLCSADTDSLTLLNGIANTVNNLGIPVYATAVETQAQADVLWSAGISGLQGYLTGK
ncbi:EAL domain-containing protein [Aestuariirhabdus sp. Z084]|uniref:bifunctional diguanylate cyclase/phosphodiesterase n=1 Tax=Aestuariirhabdus haliotis TaxID=2918751 RepID=UPI00201B3A82|nr:EAL domain-containing protein [Aestuariirhabdus haliotis]MCL6415954.1 EAL domain-containing protein [Aestuariirhabdus haliotis]MCL6420013.1 EAL domain-containing protein [Aestuariirhabdus haliotis]